jgi:AraC-like DNA-binding protein
VRQIKAAHAFRQVDQVRELARILSNIPIREYQLVAQYYLVWCHCRDLKYHNEVLENIIDQTMTYKAKALSSRGTFEWYKGNNETAFYFYLEALKASPSISEYIDLSKAIAVLKSQEGFHKSAVDDLEKLLPIVRHAEPLVRYEFLNSYAVELSNAGRSTEAESLSLLAVSSPFGPFYREWQETLLEIRSKRKRRSTVAFSQSRTEQKYEDESEVIENALQAARVQTVIDFMSANLHRKVGLSELAEMVHLSRSRFSHLFKLQTGLSPGDYLIRLRIKKAHELLITRFESIKEIMGMVGYSNRGNFIRHFKRYFDFAPSEYRKRTFSL